MIKKRLSVAAFVWACLLSGVAMAIPPQGQIHQSVLFLCAQFLVLCATLLGVDFYVQKIKESQK